MKPALLIAHRVNSLEALGQTPTDYGVELDLRDRGDRLVLQHDPFLDGEDFATYLREYGHGLMILNIKSERIEHRVLELVRGAGTVPDYFLLDCSYPMLRCLIRQGEKRVAVRFSEYEPIEMALAHEGKADWVWVDCFTRLPLTDRTYSQLRTAFRICLVSPELQGHPLEWINRFADHLRDWPIEAICTKRPDLWMRHFERSGSDS